jgi:hypothetical protein
MENVTERQRTIFETGRQVRKDMLVKQQTSQMQRLELMERVAIAIGDVLSAHDSELSPIEVIIVSGFQGIENIHLSADSRGQISTRSWLPSIDDDIPF